MIRGNFPGELSLLQVDLGTAGSGDEGKQTTLSKCSAMACHQHLISCLNSFLSVSSEPEFGAAACEVFSTPPPFVNCSLGIRRSNMSSIGESVKETRYDLCEK